MFIRHIRLKRGREEEYEKNLWDYYFSGLPDKVYSVFMEFTEEINLRPPCPMRPWK